MSMKKLLVLVPMVALLGAGTSTTVAARKCGALPPGGKPIFAIDGVVQPSGVGVTPAPVAEGDIVFVDIICMDPKDSSFNRTHGVSLISAWTKSGPAPRVEEALSVIRAAQDAQFARNGRYISSVESIRFPESMKPVSVTLVADRKGWIARTTLPRYLRTCMMFDGTVAAPPRTGPRTSECTSDR
jgi:hypothetical protein